MIFSETVGDILNELHHILLLLGETQIEMFWQVKTVREMDATGEVCPGRPAIFWRERWSGAQDQDARTVAAPPYRFGIVGSWDVAVDGLRNAESYSTFTRQV